jgi:hypothetical protein
MISRLQRFINAVNKDGNSHLLTIPPEECPPGTPHFPTHVPQQVECYLKRFFIHPCARTTPSVCVVTLCQEQFCYLCRERFSVTF